MTNQSEECGPLIEFAEAAGPEAIYNQGLDVKDVPMARILESEARPRAFSWRKSIQRARQ